MSYFVTDDNRILWRDLIDEIPPYMAAGREAPANLFDEALKALEEGLPRAYTYHILGSPDQKLALFNDAPGMDEGKFLWFMERLSANDPGKPNGGRHNYGIGIRTAALKASPYKVEVYTKRNGVTLYGSFSFQRDGYGPDEQADGNLYVQIKDLPGWLKDRSVSLKEGTLIVMHGRSKDEVTSVSTSTVGGAHWAMARRWWRIPANVTVRSQTSLSASNNGSNYVPLYDFIRPSKTSDMVKRGEYEVVTLAGGIKLHFARLSKMGSGGKRQMGFAIYNRAFGGIVYRNEVYGFHEGTQWKHACTHSGLAPVADEVCAFVELPDDYEVLITKVRDALKYKRGAALGNEGDIANIRDAATLIRDHMPDWVRDLARSKVRTITTEEEVEQKKRLAELLQEMKLFDEVVRPDPDGDDKHDNKPGGGGGNNPGNKRQKRKPGPGPRPQPRPDPGDKPGSKSKGTMVIFDVEFTDFENGDNRFFLNLGTNVDGTPVVRWNTSSKFSLSLSKHIADLAEGYSVSDVDVAILLQKGVKAAIYATVGPPYVQMHFNMQGGGWSEDDKAAATTPASLSLWVGNQIEFAARVKKTVRGLLSTEQKLAA